MKQHDLLVRVRERTRAQHEDVEKALPFHGPLTIERYTEILEGFLGLFEPIESRLGSIEIPAELRFEQRRRSPLLVKDLAALGINSEEISRIPRCSQLPTMNSVAQALGVLYVLEGSRLGGQYISKMVAERLGLTVSDGCGFFGSDGNQVGGMWREFGDAVRKTVVEEGDQERFIDSALATFTTFSTWFQERLEKTYE